eukprot:EG_transcript_18434
MCVSLSEWVWVGICQQPEIFWPGPGTSGEAGPTTLPYGGVFPIGLLASTTWHVLCSLCFNSPVFFLFERQLADASDWQLELPIREMEWQLEDASVLGPASFADVGVGPTLVQHKVEYKHLSILSCGFDGCGACASFEMQL